MHPEGRPDGGDGLSPPHGKQWRASIDIRFNVRLLSSCSSDFFTKEQFSCPDNVRHISNLIVRAEREVFLATNFWQASDTAKLVTDALKELSKRAAGRSAKVVVKIVYDRGNLQQVGFKGYN